MSRNTARIRQAKFRDPLLTLRVANALSHMADVGESMLSDTEYDVVPLLTQIRNDPDIAMAWFYAACIAVDWDSNAVKAIREQAAAIKRYAPVQSGQNS